MTLGFITNETAGGWLGPGTLQPSSTAETISAVVETEVGQAGFAGAIAFVVVDFVLVEVVDFAETVDEPDLAQTKT